MDLVELFKKTDLPSMENFNEKITGFNNIVSAIEAGAAKIQTGSYVGTGTYGASNPCSLTFDFGLYPVFAIIKGANSPSNSAFFFMTPAQNSSNTGFVQYSYSMTDFGALNSKNYVRRGNGFMQWYSQESADLQLNGAYTSGQGFVYNYAVVLGKS